MAVAEPQVVITVALRQLDPATVPQVCLKTGERAQCLIPTVASGAPSWAWVLIAAGGAPYFAARRWWFPRESLSLPARNVVYEQTQLLRRATAGFFAVALVLLGWSAVTLQPVGVLAAGFVGALATGGWLTLSPRVWVIAELDGDRVRLVGVHSSVARAFGRA